MRTLAVHALLVSLVASSASAAESSVKDHPAVIEALALVEVWADAKAAYDDIPGVSLAVVHDQEVLFAKGFGYADRARQAEATPETLYSICSISKLFTAIGVLQLRDQGKLQLDDPVARHLPWMDIGQSFEDPPPITVRGLLTHSAGLPRESAHDYWTDEDYTFPTREEIRQKLASQETLYPEGRYFQYSNLGLTLAGEIVAELSGMTYADYARTKILDPLGLDDTTPEIPIEHKGGRFATGYSGVRREGEREPLSFFQVRGIAPAAGYASSVLDLAKFASWQFRLFASGGEEVLKARTLREMQRVQWIDPDWNGSWGLGFSVSRDGDDTLVGHGGSCPGFRSDLKLDTKHRIAAVVMTNANGADAGTFTRRAIEIVRPAIASASAKRPEDGETEQPLVEPYIGTYENPWGGEIAILPWKEGLAMLSLPTEDPMRGLEELRPMGAGQFRRVRDDGELAEPIVFTVENGKATRFERHSNLYHRR